MLEACSTHTRAAHIDCAVCAGSRWLHQPVIKRTSRWTVTALKQGPSQWTRGLLGPVGRMPRRGANWFPAATAVLQPRELQRFHHDCVRAMCRVNLSHTRRRRITMHTLLSEVGVRQLRWYYETRLQLTRLLRWVGHVVRMPIDRLPRKMLTAWVPSKRVLGCPRMTYGRTVKKALMNCGIWPRYTKFTEPPGWGDMNADTQSSLRREHSAAKSAHDKEHEWKWTEKAAQREEWRTLIRGPDPPKRAARPKSTRRPPQQKRSKTPNNNNPLHHHLKGRRLNLRTSLVVQHETQLGHALTKMHNPHAAGGGSGDTTKPGNYSIIRH